MLFEFYDIYMFVHCTVENSLKFKPGKQVET